MMIFFRSIGLFETALNIGILRMSGERRRRTFPEGAMFRQSGEFFFMPAASGRAGGGPPDRRPG